MFLRYKTAQPLPATMEKERTDKISEQSARLILKSKELIQRSHKILEGFQNVSSSVRLGFGLPTPKRKSKAARASSRHTS